MLRINQNGFSIIEALLAGSLLSIVVAGLFASIISGQESARLSGERVRASYLAEEGIEAVRSIRDAAFTNFADGTYGLGISGNQYTLTGTSDTTGAFTRSILIGTVDSDTKSVISTVTWQQNLQRSGSVSLETRITNWLAAKPQVLGDWSQPSEESTFDVSGGQDGLKIATSGNYAYMVRAGGNPDFFVFDITNPASPAQIGSLNVAGSPTNIVVSGNYAYVTSTQNNAELQIIDITNPASPAAAGSYNAPGNADANGLFVNGSTVYFVRTASTSNEFFIVNASVPTVPALLGSMSLADAGNEVVVLGATAYVASAGNGNELVAINITNPAAPSQIGTLNVAGNNDALTITGFNTTVLLGTDDGRLAIINVANPASPSLLSTFTVQTSGVLSDIDLGRSNTYAFTASTDSGNPEFQVVDITDTSNPILYGSVDLTFPLSGVVYSATLDRAVIAASNNTEEFKIMKPQ